MFVIALQRMETRIVHNSHLAKHIVDFHQTKYLYYLYAGRHMKCMLAGMCVSVCVCLCMCLCVCASEDVMCSNHIVYVVVCVDQLEARATQ